MTRNFLSLFLSKSRTLRGGSCSRCLSMTHVQSNSLKNLFAKKDRITIIRFPEEQTSNLDNEKRSATDSEELVETSQNVQLSLEDVRSKKVQFLPLYHFKYVTHVRMVSRMKIYLTALTAGVLPPYVATLYLNEI